MRKTFIWIRAVREDSVLVMLPDWSGPTELPRELFTDKEFKQLRHHKRFTGYWNATRMVEKLAIAGPFTMLED